MIIGAQYLEPGPHSVSAQPAEIRARLRAACARLPISLVMIGWQLSEAAVAACADEAARAKAQLFRWHPLITSEGAPNARPEWRTVGLDGQPIGDPAQLHEPFSFLCPNHPDVQQALHDHIERVVAQARYDGLFLDRIRFPSPAADPEHLLACFCDHCRRAAAAQQLDLAEIQAQIRASLQSAQGRRMLVEALLSPQAAENSVIAELLRFRMQSISACVERAAAAIRAHGLSVGLDCFSPSLATMVGQDLGALGGCSDWIKIMSYGHTLGPAGIPYELRALLDWLVARQAAAEHEALRLLAQATGFSLPSSRGELMERGISPQDLALECRRGRQAGVPTLLAGIELVKLEGVTNLSQDQVSADLQAFRSSGVAGLVLSWDLWHIPAELLQLNVAG